MKLYQHAKNQVQTPLKMPLNRAMIKSAPQHLEWKDIP